MSRSRIVLKTLSLKIPLYFFSSNFEPDFGMEVTIDSFMNFGMVPSLFMVFNIVSRLDFKSTPITLI